MRVNAPDAAVGTKFQSAQRSEPRLTEVEVDRRLLLAPRQPPAQHASCMIASTTLQDSPSRLPTAETAAHSRSITNASNIAVDPEPGSAHGIAPAIGRCLGDPTVWVLTFLLDK